MKRLLSIITLLAFVAIIPSIAASADNFLSAEQKSDIRVYIGNLPVNIESDINYWIERLSKDTGPISGVGFIFSLYREERDGKKVFEIQEVIKDRPAEKAGLRKGDIIHSINGKSLDTSDEVVKDIRGDNNPGRAVVFEIERGGNRFSVLMNTVLLRPDKTAEAQKLQQTIRTEGRSFLALIKRVSGDLLKALEKPLTVDHPSIIAFNQVDGQYNEWFDQKEEEIKKLLEIK